VRAVLSLLAALAVLLAARPSEAGEDLPKLGIELDATSVSGLSAGAYMAGQIELAHSRQIVGAGIVGGGPFACAESVAGRLVPFWPTAVWQNAEQARYGCMADTLGPPDVPALVKRAKELAAEGAIDPLDGLADDKVYLFSGNDDRTVLRSVVEAARRFYTEAGVPAANVTLVEKEGGHAFISADEGTACGLSERPFVNDCDYDQARAILEWIYGPLSDPAAAPGGKFIVFDQSAYAKHVPDGLAREGMVYVPPACAGQAGCRLHVVLHGCDQEREAVGDTFIKESGFPELADTNRFVILFPQVTGNLLNPQSCFDWWGYTDLDYLGKDAAQIAAIWAMVEQLARRP
jgi:poly(3-hydroxybutyrate) depolymerase